MVGLVKVIVWATFVMVMPFATDDAEAHAASPACAAVTVHVPAAITVRAVPDAVHKVEGDAVNVTGRPDDDVAARVNGD